MSISLIEKILRESEGYTEVNTTRFLLHISDPKFRYSILQKGLIPKASGDKWKHLKFFYDKAVFATPFKNSIDFHDLDELSMYIYPLPLLQKKCNKR